MFNGSGRDTKFGDRMRAAETRASDAERQNRALITLVKRLGELGIMQDDQYASAWKDIRPWLS